MGLIVHVVAFGMRWARLAPSVPAVYSAARAKATALGFADVPAPLQIAPDGRRIRPRRKRDPRPLEQQIAQYDLEVALADRLRHAPKAERGRLYGAVYDELYAKMPHHSQFRKRADADKTRVDRQFRSLRGFLGPDKVFLEVGAGDCHLSFRAASVCRSVVAVDVSDKVADLAAAPGNFAHVLSDGTSIPVPEGSVDVAYSADLMEHLHPGDAAEQLVNIRTALKPDGVYVCSTPNRLTGPHDISGLFDGVARGFHLKEYTAAELRGMMLDAGFRRVRFQVSVAGALVFRNPAPVALEWLVDRGRRWAGLDLARLRPVNIALRVRAVATK
ncbi:MAG: methyltransferase domain-containing protein [Alphaproteobacteria bacterium]|nr:methyltransferase domain-containing protein [Alphaproteobacteria bacterium]